MKMSAHWFTSAAADLHFGVHADWGGMERQLSWELPTILLYCTHRSVAPLPPRPPTPPHLAAATPPGMNDEGTVLLPGGWVKTPAPSAPMLDGCAPCQRQGGHLLSVHTEDSLQRSNPAQPEPLSAQGQVTAYLLLPVYLPL
ncbi:hypothetical protein GN956_G15146 [Arapaima gigas]